MKWIFHPDALAEFADAALYYSDRVPGLGADFVDEIESAIQKISEDPSCWPCIDEDIRRYLVHRFPYGLLYVVENDHLLIVAVMHLSREPGYWRHRVQ